MYKPDGFALDQLLILHVSTSIASNLRRINRNFDELFVPNEVINVQKTHKTLHPALSKLLLIKLFFCSNCTKTYIYI